MSIDLPFPPEDFRMLILPGSTLPKDAIDALSIDQLASFMRLAARFGVSRIVDVGTHYELVA